MVEINRLTEMNGRSLTSEQYSQMVMPVTMLNSSVIARGFRKLVTMAATKKTLVMVRTMKFFIPV